MSFGFQENISLLGTGDINVAMETTFPDQLSLHPSYLISSVIIDLVLCEIILTHIIQLVTCLTYYNVIKCVFEANFFKISS